ncbi:DUF1573 domain-containing protein [uncultured Prevotella sp.]|uniref:DUF1573 domain-containing protein n=1 Tax=uncultured Prevotella sp. TaxID=159272 RepID=UPI00262D65CE|nr:DUF1573 domain-containing protein [uncultured Prevotella sp.]
MNNKSIILSLLAMASLDAMAQRISAKNEIIDCGNVLYESPVTVKFELTNKGNELNIDQVRVSCGCTTVDYPRQTIHRGDPFTVTATYDARQLGHFEKEVALFCNSSTKPFYLKMRGVVVEEANDFTGNFSYKVGGLMVDKNDVEFDDVNRGDYPVQLIHIRNNTPETVSPVIMHLPSYITATVSPTHIAPGKTGVASLKLDSRKLRDLGLTQTSVFLGKKPGEKVSLDKEISVSAVLLPDFDNMSETQLANAPKINLSETTLDLGSFGDKSSKSGIIFIENTGRSELDIRSMQMFTSGMSVKLNKSKLKPGEQAKLKITVNKKLLRSARSKPRVLMITNDPTQPKVVVKVKVK